ncbi:PREDICTED: probably inactive leucine-rich repeat receptor-like protein kinase At5g48380 [Theobroma cacao]|uniref:BAK1-interacting receptor-like kinase 1 isoform 1 n=2 Tax=Theobroma cacao TaxID=3641 RepID=A0A061EW52_THECC|nr:PREDICTED: probably inactive leucine-rich repeat receptor-like protein kinase At5g48380 [Theobroma cacao]EOY08626.1 BAK1-interacting receptor-like kinase 1 isoform 1 [Theobroma cacao]EOY08627.1 BAK1-interacting receptor-like kinase 1 isoform 1 [Theobroma cacao]
MNFCWDMALNGKALAVLGYNLICFALVLLSGRVCQATPNDIECLKSVKASLEDPYSYLSSWNFNNGTEGFICKFTGVDCWHPDENKVLNIRLSDLGLKGRFPQGIGKCESLTGLDLSSNKLSGLIPSDISEKLKYVTTLDLSDNNFSGPIPPSLANCSFLNVLKLGNNRLTGAIPLQLGVLNRIKTFNVANNQLSGQIPDFGPNVTIQADSYANNPGLCGKILQPCPGIPMKSRVGTIAASAVGGVTITAIIVGIILFYFSRGAAMKKKEDDPEGNKWAKTIKGKKGIKVSMFEESVSKMRLSDLMNSTNEFSKSNIIGMGRTGTMYKAMIPDGYCLMIKRLEDFQRLEKEFVSEMNTLGSVKHRNLVPLLGFCVAKKERFLVYKYMENGTLYDKLHPAEPEVRNMDWPLRLRIGIGAARGLAWLHHNCNPRIIHRNISSKCILLDGDCEPKLSDFGLARLMNPIDTHLSTFVNGEFGDLGYVAPEYPRTLVATPKGDIYSFGVVLLELITGEKPTHVVNAPESFRGSLAEWITQLSSSFLLQTAIDKSLLGNGFDSEVMQFLRVACNCVLPTPKERPTMFEVYQLLRAIGEGYHFTTEDEIMQPSNSNNTDVPELIVAQEAK